VLGESSLREIALAIQKGATVDVGAGFHDRNTAISNVDVLIAYTFGSGPYLKDGGTADTMSKYLKSHSGSANLSYHVNLPSLEVFAGAQVGKPKAQLDLGF
jgi:hypothetical protein